MSSVRNWDELVAEGRELKVMEERIDAEHGNIRWQWGDLALEVAPMGSGPGGVGNGSTEILERYAKEIDTSFTALLEYRRVANAWPIAMRVAMQPWICHQILASKKYEEIREEVIANPVEVDPEQKHGAGPQERWTQRMLQRYLGHAESPVHRPKPQTSAEKLAEIGDMVATIGDDEAVEFIDKMVDLLGALDERTPRPDPAPPAPLTERWERWLNQANGLFIAAAKLKRETEEAGEQLGGHASFAMYLADRFSERKLDAELRELLEAEGAG